ncbi:MAG: beta-lactamase, partial [Edaphobacter sp.]|nr:beta-lactamase [Edaphobacter sp.]
GVGEYLAAVRRSLLIIGLAPVWLLLAVLFLLHWPTWPVAGHLAVLGLVGVIVVELCLHGFHKFPFACSYLPGQSKVHVVFWGLFLVLAPLSAARTERGLLNRPISCLCMVALLAAIAAAARWRTDASAKSAEGLVFEEEYPPDLLALGLDGRQAVRRAA